MPRVVCPRCRTGFEAKLSRSDYAVNCVSCGVAFNAASFLPREDFEAIAEKRPPASASPLDKGTNAAGNVIRASEAPVFAEPAGPDTRTGGLFPVPEDFDEADGPAVTAPVPDGAACAHEPPKRIPRLFSLASAPVGQASRLPDPSVAQASRLPDSSVAQASRLPEAQSSRPSGPASLPAVLRNAAPAEAASAAAEEPRLPSPAPDVPHARPAPPPVPKEQRDTAAPKLPPGHTRPPLLQGSFGPFEIETEIARGGVGAVFRAHERDGGRPVALKVLLDGAEAEECERERFRRECETAQALSLPGMVQIYAVGEIDGKPFMAMELVEGRSLDRLIQERTLTVQEGLVIMQGVAETVGALHKAGYVHRDLKPANILLDQYNVPKVADFGLVKSLDEVTRLTASGLVCGTPAYMAPEQARGDGRAIDPRTDVWALGAVLYEVLTYHPPFQADNALRLMLKITKEHPRPPHELNPKIPRDAEQIVMRCLDKNPERRYPDGQALAQDLGRFLEGQPIEARKTTGVQSLFQTASEKRRILIGVGLAVAAVFLAAVLARFLLAPHEAGPIAERGWNECRAGRLVEAEDCFRKALKLDPKQARATLGLGRVMGVKSLDAQTRRVKDVEAFKEALRYTEEAGKDSQLAGEAAAQTAWLFMNASLVEYEVKAREHAVALRNDNPGYYQALGLAYWNLGAKARRREYYEKAQRAFQMALSLDPQQKRTPEYIRRLQEQFLARPASADAGTPPVSEEALPRPASVVTTQ